jgi:hypothetical protein
MPSISDLCISLWKMIKLFKQWQILSDLVGGEGWLRGCWDRGMVANKRRAFKAERPRTVRLTVLYCNENENEVTILDTHSDTR